MESECSKGTTRKPTGIDFPKNQRQSLQSMTYHISLSCVYHQLVKITAIRHEQF